MTKSVWVLLLVLLLLTSSFALAATPGQSLKSAFSSILDVGSLKFLLGGQADNQFFGFVRIAIAVLIFALLYMGLSLIPNMSRNTAIVVGIILAIISAVFIPKSVLAAMGETYAVIFSFLIIGGPIAGVGWLVFGTPTLNRFAAALKFFAVLLLMWLVNEIGHWAAKLTAIA
ncbi:hypothetical protein HYU22_01290 [Candidatus Woesearchaeota archaeon]|nr:hypothetical protein [Candidatus Woesearchaeota archaeon]